MMHDSFATALDELARAESPRHYGVAFVRLFPVNGAAVSTLGDLLGSETLSATDGRAARLDELQFDLGEGPCWDALRSGRPVSESAMATGGRSRWPAFADAAHGEDVTSMFAFPLIVGPLRIGAVDMYSHEPLTLSDTQTRRASALAEVVGRSVLRNALKSLDDLEPANNPHSRRVVHQATGVVLAQLDISADDAQLVVQAHAFTTGRAVMDVATEVVNGVLRFHRVDGRIEVMP
ncbi:GAF and ANTAR domain-containing protein [Microbacterium sp. Root166]|uniref:GAF and ANTAR domain-containing protein n=1 Tax=Microbacterium sp. Root166 TaxID=1736478 RepID=UPI000B2FA287|nr:GAF and ANTAR domain-containing protein [Microbacterium sp. Root166]